MSITCSSRRACGTGPSSSPTPSGSAWPAELAFSSASTGWPGDPVHLGDTVRPAIHGNYFLRYGGHRCLAQVANAGQSEELLRVSASRADPDQPDSGRVVLDLVPADGVVGARFVDHQDIPEAARAHAGRLAGERDLGDVIEVDRRHQPLAVCGTVHGPGQHMNAAVGVAGAPDPGAGRPGELAMLVLLGILA